MCGDNSPKKLALINPVVNKLPEEPPAPPKIKDASKDSKLKGRKSLKIDLIGAPSQSGVNI